MCIADRPQSGAGWRKVPAVALALALSGATGSLAQEPSQPGAAALQDVPPGVLRAAEEVAAQPLEGAAIVENGGPTYEVYATDAAGRKLTIVVGADGTVHQLVREIDRVDVPDPVVSAVQFEVPGFAATAYAAIEADGEVTGYRMEGTADGQLYDVSVGADGRDITISSAM